MGRLGARVVEGAAGDRKVDARLQLRPCRHGFSDPGPMPRTSVRIAEELHTALHHAGIAGPYILVGSAFGGDNVRAFADLYMSEVAGLVLVDADADDLEPKAMQEERHRGQAAIPSDLRDCRNLIAETQTVAG